MLSRGNEFIAATAPFLALATIILSFRIYTRIVISKNPGLEDLFVTLAWICACGLFAIIAWLTVNNGLGDHIFELPPTQLKDIGGFLKGFWVGIFFYNFALSACKASIFLQYLRLFSGWTKRISWVCLALIGANACWGFVINLLFCIPVKKFWNPSIEGHCLPREAVWFSFAGANIATSCIAILVPIPAVLQLKMATRTKLALVAIFCLGIVDIVLAALRLRSLRRLSHEFDVTFYLRDVAIWSSLESTVAIICASAPVLRPLIARVFPRFFSTNKSTGESSKYGQGSRLSALQPYSAKRASTLGYDTNNKAVSDQQSGDSTRSLRVGHDAQDYEYATFLDDGDEHEVIHAK